MRKIRLLVSLLFLVINVGCDPDEKLKKSESPSLIAKIDGEDFRFENPEVLIKTINGHPYTQAIQGDIISDGTIHKTLYITYAGDLGADNFMLIGGIYYENDFKDGWSCFCPETLEMTVTDITTDKVSGYLSDFTAEGDKGSKRITDVKFSSIPINRLNL